MILEGLVEGNIVSQSNVVVREGAHIIGDVDSPKVEIAGEVEGSIRAEEILLYPTGRIKGDVLLWAAMNGAERNGAEDVIPGAKPRMLKALPDMTAGPLEDESPARVSPPAARSTSAILQPIPTRAFVEPPHLAPLPPVETVPAAPQVHGTAIELTAGPFARFSQLAEFMQALSALPGIEKVDTRQFYQGTVQLRVRYNSPIPLATRLGELQQFRPAISVTSSGQIEVRLQMLALTSPGGGDQAGEAAQPASG